MNQMIPSAFLRIVAAINVIKIANIDVTEDAL